MLVFGFLHSGSVAQPFLGENLSCLTEFASMSACFFFKERIEHVHVFLRSEILLDTLYCNFGRAERHNCLRYTWCSLYWGSTVFGYGLS